METVRDFNSIVHSPPFTFLVGKDHTKLTIQSALTRHVSKPLDQLMNNGQTRESKHRIAVLEEEEVEVFIAFCEYAYTCDYTVPAAAPEPEPSQIVDPWRDLIRAQSNVSFIPPPVPSPPPERVAPREEAGDNESKGESADTLPEQAATPPEETAGENPPPTQEGEDPSTGGAGEKKGKKKAKKDKKKQKAASTGFLEEPAAASLTPPSTPPLQEKEAEEPAQEEATQKEPLTDRPPQEDTEHDIAVETDPGDSHSDNWWERPISPRNHPEGQERKQEGTAEKSKKPDHISIIDTTFASQRITIPRTKGARTWGEFAALEYVHEPPAAFDPSTNLPSKPPVPYILFHAKVYVFATRYLIPGLAQLCLKKLHRDLLDFALPLPAENEEGDEDEDEANDFEARAKMILDLLQYAYDKTTRFEPECQTSATLLRESELRKLVTQYAACKMRELAAYTPASIPIPTSPSHGPGSGVNVVAAPGGGLRELLDTTTELASDLVFRMM